ncbi:class IV adenylate cyclase [Tissierella sp.]|uniref:class IV adenylate cyclase n=1 Tax=Tissierella sp. TaxID=41274 RepID=UPI0028543A26|nr:class IV adenylate cyclase [Tissierella sp.]MDR7855811.1 class IV adenylate cyclase [Tissierella sp.]
MRELEVKILNVDLEEMESKLIALDATLISRERQVNTLIDSEDGFIENNLDSYLRIRETKSYLNNDIKYTLTMKKNINREGLRENIESNVDISDKDTMLSILEDLGYVVVQEGFKERTSYTLGNVRFDLDRWDENTYPYPYMEIEVNDEDELKEMIKLLDIPKENISTKSIVELRREAKLM